MCQVLLVGLYIPFPTFLILFSFFFFFCNPFFLFVFGCKKKNASNLWERKEKKNFYFGEILSKKKQTTQPVVYCYAQPTASSTNFIERISN